VRNEDEDENTDGGRRGWDRVVVGLSLCGRDTDANNAVKAEMGIRLGTQAPFFCFAFVFTMKAVPAKAKTMDQLRIFTSRLYRMLPG